MWSRARERLNLLSATSFGHQIETGYIGHPFLSKIGSVRTLTISSFDMAVSATTSISFALSADAINHLSVNAELTAVSVSLMYVPEPPGPAVSTAHVYYAC